MKLKECRLNYGYYIMQIPIFNKKKKLIYLYYKYSKYTYHSIFILINKCLVTIIQSGFFFF